MKLLWLRCNQELSMLVVSISMVFFCTEDDKFQSLPWFNIATKVQYLTASHVYKCLHLNYYLQVIEHTRDQLDTSSGTILGIVKIQRYFWI